MIIFNKSDKDYSKLLNFLSKLRIDENALNNFFLLKKSRYLFTTRKDLFEFVESINSDIFYIGELLGEFKKEFIPSPLFVDYLSKFSVKQIILEGKKEFLFLCKKDIFLDSNKNSFKNQFVFVQTQHNENIGLGIVKNKRSKLVLNNFIDKGAYVRKEI